MEAKPSAKPATSRGEYKQSPNASCACAASSSNGKQGCRVSALRRRERANNNSERTQRRTHSAAPCSRHTHGRCIAAGEAREHGKR
jgi:hypothetical protein